jgi:ketosteroid isomerase-like protein
MSYLAPDILSFDVVDQLQQIGSDASRKRAAKWFSSFEGPIGYEMQDLSITAGDDVAFCHGLSHVSATIKDGGELDMWWRMTICFKKFEGRWMVMHEHNSIPFDVESGKASLGLKP